MQIDLSLLLLLLMLCSSQVRLGRGDHLMGIQVDLMMMPLKSLSAPALSTLKLLLYVANVTFVTLKLCVALE